MFFGLKWSVLTKLFSVSFQLTIFLGELNQLLPVVVHAEEEGVSNNDQQRLGTRDGHIEPGQKWIFRFDYTPIY